MTTEMPAGASPLPLPEMIPEMQEVASLLRVGESP